MKVVLYSKEKCLECDRARSLLESIGVSHLEYKLGRDYNEKQFCAEFGERAEFPQVAIDYKHIGSLKETLQYLKEKQLI
jgi:glutaredoxin